jgi:uncharacterized membrane protein YtjA (UPF0391 family)
VNHEARSAQAGQKRRDYPADTGKRSLFGRSVIPSLIKDKEVYMSSTWAAVYFTIAIIAVLFGFGGMAGTEPSVAPIAKILYFTLLTLFVVALIFGRQREDRSG